MTLTPLTPYLSLLPSSDIPLSADVYFIRGARYTYIVDVGRNDDAFEAIKNTPDKKVIITHFHEDHTENLRRLMIPEEDLYVGGYTRKGVGYGTEITSQTVIDDGIKLVITPIPNSHAKGSLCVAVNDEYLIMGDAFYSNVKGYNVSQLGEEIKLLKNLEYKYVLMSHKEKLHEKNEVIKILEDIFSKREKDNPFIQVGYDE